MIAVVERVNCAYVVADGAEAGRIGKGLLVLLGVEKDDNESDVMYIARKTAGLRIFEDGGKMTLSVADVKGEVLIVSQFTLAGDVRKGKRPDFSNAADAQRARKLYEQCIAALNKMGIKTATGVFGAHMRVDSSGDGPVTILLNSKRKY
ncbi:MAG: D-aminoacyl-tRNA deacylase [Christensenellales bacterium]|jgi:D-tyrosyl-tRNA(Tyr) deacylase